MILHRKLYMVLGCVILLPLVSVAKREVYVDLTLQKAYAVEDGVLKFEGRISSGNIGHETPTGTFTVLQKDKNHVSNLYPKPNGGTKMPYMMRLTWDGIAMHQGYVAKRPVSHGCIRLKHKFAQKLFSWVDKGTRVIVEGDVDSFYQYDKKGSLYKKDKDGYKLIEVYY